MLLHLQASCDTPGWDGELAGMERKQLRDTIVCLKGCGQWLLFRDYYTVGKIRLAGARFCKKTLLCPLCAIRRATKLLNAYVQRWEAVQVKHPRLKPYLVTFTIRNTETLDEGFRRLVAAYKTLLTRRRDFLRRGIGWTEIAQADGAVWSVELTRSAQGWHPHIHAIWLCKDAPRVGWVNHDTGQGHGLRKEWFDITGDSFEVDVRPIAAASRDELVRGFVEVFKYALKFAGLSLADNWIAYQELRQRRLVGSFGCLRGVTLPDTLADNLLDDLPYFELFYRYLPGRGYHPGHRERKKST